MLLTGTIYFLIWKGILTLSRKIPALLSIAYHSIAIGFILFLFPVISLILSADMGFRCLLLGESPSFAFSGSVRMNSCAKMFLAIWLCGAAVRTFQFSISQWIVKKNLAHCIPVNQSVTENCLSELCTQLQIQTIPRLLYCRSLPAPITLYQNGCCVLLPIKKYTDEEIQMILLHELTHIKNHDLLRIHLGNLLTILYWFYPPAYLFRSNLELCCEQVCDQAVLSFFERNSDRNEVFTKYFHLLLSHLQPKQKMRFSLSLGTHRQLKARMRVAKADSKSRFLISFPVTAVLTAALLLLPIQTVLANVGFLQQQFYRIYDSTVINMEEEMIPNIDTEYCEPEDPELWVSLSASDENNSAVPYVSSSINWTLAPGERQNSSLYPLNVGSSLRVGGVYEPTDTTVNVGISDGSTKRYINASNGIFSHAFSISAENSYRIFIQNTGDKTIIVNFSIQY